MKTQLPLCMKYRLRRYESGTLCRMNMRGYLIAQIYLF